MADAHEQYAEQLLGVVNDTARVVGTRFVTFLTVGLYIAITVAATTDEMLVKGSLVTLPLLNAQIPITGWFGFYIVAPWLMVALHLDLFLQLSLLGAKLSSFNAAAAELGEEQRRHFRERMSSFYYVQFLAGEAGSRLLRPLSGLMLYGGVIVFPLTLLCWMQARFLALHNPSVTWGHRLTIIGDVIVILVFLSRPLSARDTLRFRHDSAVRAPPRALPSATILTLATCAAAFVFCIVAGIPDQRPTKGSWFGGWLASWFEYRNLDLHERVLTADKLSADLINALDKGPVPQREQALDMISRFGFFQGRDLRYANLFKAVLPKLDLRGETQLQGANLGWTQMQEVMLQSANLQGAILVGAQLQGGILERARLRNADLALADLQDAKLSHADLTGASLREAHLEGADLSDAVLREARLAGAQLQGAILRRTQLQGADLSGANLEGADLSEAQLEGASFRAARLKGAAMRGAAVGGADFTDANLELTDLQYRPDVSVYLAELACADTYVARGLSAQASRACAVRSPSPCSDTFL